MSKSLEPISSLLAAKIVCKDSNWSLSNLKLQKILYLAQLLYIGVMNKPIIRESFEAWDYGPVIPTLYNRVKCFGSHAIQDVFWGVNTDLCDERIKAHLKKVFISLNKLSSADLVAMTHRKGGAWNKNYRIDRTNSKISLDDINKEYCFKRK